MANKKITIEVELIGHEEVIKQLKEIRDLSKEITGRLESPLISLGEMYKAIDKNIERHTLR